MALSDELVAADIANPEQLTIDMLSFGSDHGMLMNKVNKLLLLGIPFEGGTNPISCPLGKWLSNMPTTNPQIVTAMKKLRPIHAHFHRGVAEIKQLTTAGEKEMAKEVLKNRLYPLADEAFGLTGEVIGLSKEYHNKFEKINKTLLHEAEKNQHETFAALDAIVQKAKNYADRYTQSAINTTEKGKTIAIICMVAGTALALILGTILTTMITRPLSKGVELAKSMAEGDITKELDIKQGDEIGILADSLNNMTRQLRHMLTNIINEVGQVNNSSKNLTAIAGEMTHGAEDTASRSNQVAAAAEQMSANQNSVAAAMEQAATNVNQVAAATEQMRSTIADISGNSERAKSITDQAVGKSRSASERVEQLGQAARKITKVTETINEISSQTNLLALNATIEAATAGEAGKGFAVVANEIKDLARQTADATLDIQEKIEGIQQATEITVQEINDISDVISEVDQVVTTIVAAVEEQSAATGEIATNVGQVSEGIAEVNENVAQSTTVSAEIAADVSEVSNHANKMTASSNGVRDMAEELARVAGKLQEMVSRFKISNTESYSTV
ncbi:MAG: chemotaxis protein [Desulfobacterales bacterium]|nr:MAG: chemotaxis protein [Desulfobacterales bacterium]